MNCFFFSREEDEVVITSEEGPRISGLVASWLVGARRPASPLAARLARLARCREMDRPMEENPP